MRLMSFIVAIGIVSYGEAARCKSTIHYATTSNILIGHQNYENNEDCVLEIRPNATYGSDHYLEITWWSFDVKGKMPECKEDFVDVSVTRSQQSVGRFCSNNTEGSPFKMFSYDGHAKIRFVSDAQGTGNGFEVFIELKPFSQPLGSSQSQDCIKSYQITHTGFVHSTGWPLGYSSSQTKCRHEIIPGNNIVWKETVITIMDLDVNNRSPASCDEQDDYIQIKGSDGQTPVKEKLISGRLCRLDGMKIFRTRYKNIYIDFVRSRGSENKYRGYLVGYKGYFFKSGTVGPDENRTITNGSSGGNGTKDWKNKTGGATNVLISLNLICIALISSKIFLALLT